MEGVVCSFFRGVLVFKLYEIGRDGVEEGCYEEKYKGMVVVKFYF